MNGHELDELIERFPLEKRPEVREFAGMTPDAQRIHLFATVTELKDDVAAIKNPQGPRAHVAQAGYTTLAIIGTVLAIVSGRLPMPE